MNDLIKQEIESKKLFSIQDMRTIFEYAAGKPLANSDKILRDRLAEAAFKEAVSRIAKEDPDSSERMTPQAIYAKFRCDMYNRFMDHIDNGASMSFEEMERWVDRATEFVMKTDE